MLFTPHFIPKTLRSKSSNKPEEKDSGFSLIELIVVVVIIGIIIAIAIPMFLNAQDNARQAAVETTAKDAHTMVRASIIDGSSPHGGDLSVLETDDIVVSLADTFVIGDESTVCVRADWVGTENYAISGPCNESDTTAPIFDREPDDPLYTQLTYQCPTTRSGYLGVVNIGGDTRVQIWEDNDRDATIREVFYDAPPESFDLRSKTRREILRTRLAEETDIATANDAIQDAIDRANDSGVGERYAPEYAMSETVENVSELIEMEGEVTYKVRFDGEIETFAAPGHRGHSEGNIEESLADCLVSIDHFGDDINLKNIVYLGGENLSYVPDSIPESVRALRGAFENATHFNDPNIRTWDVSNVHTMRSMFHNTLRFNQDISGWNTESLIYPNSMFSRAYAFNQDINDWDVSNATTMEMMFYEAEDFNQPLDKWDTAAVTDMARVFDGATSFNQDISGWNVENVETFSLFNRDTLHWKKDLCQTSTTEGLL